MLSDIAELEDSDWTDLYASSFPTASVQVHSDPWHVSHSLITAPAQRLALTLLGRDVD